MPKHTHTHMHTYENIYSHECMIFDTEKYVHIRTYAQAYHHQHYYLHNPTCFPTCCRASPSTNMSVRPSFSPPGVPACLFVDGVVVSSSDSMTVGSWLEEEACRGGVAVRAGREEEGPV
jgi:hypothetical protein